jgi:hypothetical protein
MSISLTDGLIVVVRRIGHCHHQTSSLYCFFVVYFMILSVTRLYSVVSFLYISMYAVTLKIRYKVSRREKFLHWIFNVERYRNEPDVLQTVQIILNFKYPQLHNHWASDPCLCDISDWKWLQQYDTGVVTYSHGTFCTMKLIKIR